MKKSMKMITVIAVIGVVSVTMYRLQNTCPSQDKLTILNINALANNEENGSDYKKKITTTTSCEDWIPIEDNLYIHETYDEVCVDCEGWGRIACVKDCYKENVNVEVVEKK